MNVQENVDALSKTVTLMTDRLHASREQTASVLRAAGALRAQRYRTFDFPFDLPVRDDARIRADAAQAVAKKVALTPEEAAILTRGEINDEFFQILARAQSAREVASSLARSGHQSGYFLML